MAFESIPRPEEGQENDEKRVRFEEGGRAFSMTPQEKEAHEKAERRRKMMTEGGAGTLEIKDGGKKEEVQLTEEEQEMLEEMVPDARMRANMDPEVIRTFLDAKREELEKKNKRAA